MMLGLDLVPVLTPKMVMLIALYAGIGLTVGIYSVMFAINVIMILFTPKIELKE